MKQWLVDYTEWNDFLGEDIPYSIQIQAISSRDALQKAVDMGLEDAEVAGEMKMSIPQKEDGTPDWGNAIDYDQIENN
jgi:hypothetical protein